MNDDTVTIPSKEYTDLLERARWLDALEGAGVDNWCGIDEAADIFNVDEEE